MHPAVLEELSWKFSLRIHPLVHIAAVLSLVGEVCAMGLSLFDTPILLLPELAFLGYTVTSILYLLVWSEKRKAEVVSCMRLGFAVYAALLFLPLIYPGSIVILLSIAFGAFHSWSWWLYMSGIVLIYGNIVSFVAILSRDKDKILQRQLTAMKMVQQPLLPQKAI